MTNANKIQAARQLSRLTITGVLTLTSILLYGQEYLYGLTQDGGAYNKGVPFQISTDGTAYINYGDLNGDNGEKPGNGAALVQILSNRLATLTSLGDQNLGLGNRFDITVGQGGILPPFQFHFSMDQTGTNPQGRLLYATDGQLYALTSTNGQFGGGALVQMQAFAGTGPHPLFEFGGVNGRSPKGSLIEGANGKFYGMTELGGANDLGVIFSYDNSGYHKLLDFNGAVNGANPTGSLVLGSDGNLYGMTKSGGANGAGIIFRIALDGTLFTKLLDLNASITGSVPLGSLTQFSDGKLYGMTSAGGVNGFGTIFSITTTGTFLKLVDFDGTNGKSPTGDLLVSPSGNVMYGVAFAGGTNDLGTVFKLDNGTTFTKLFDFSATTGSHPVGTLVMLRQSQQITFSPLVAKNTQSDPFTVVANSTSGLPVSFVSSDPSVASVSNNVVTIAGSGSTFISPLQTGNYTYLASVFSAGQLLLVNKVGQTITLDSVPQKTFGDPPITLHATSSSGLPVTLSYAQDTNVIGLSSNTMSIQGAGVASIIAHQDGNSVYAPAAIVSTPIIVGKADQTVSFATDSVKTCCAFYMLSAAATSGEDVLFKSSDLEVLTIYDNEAEMQKPGVVEITAYQPGNANYKKAEVTKKVTIQRGSQTIVGLIINSPYQFGIDSVYVPAGSTSGLPVTFTSDPPGIAELYGQVLYLTGIGSTTITATQSGDVRYLPATPVTLSVTVNPPDVPVLTNSIRWHTLAPITVTAPPFNLTAEASSGLIVSYSSSNSNVATVVGNLVTTTGIGSTIITAFQTGAGTIPAATPVARTLTVTKDFQFVPELEQDISVRYGTDPMPLPVNASSGLPISYVSTDTTVIAVQNHYLYFVGWGQATLILSQSGDSRFSPATATSTNVVVDPLAQYITFNALPSTYYGDSSLVLSAKASSGLPVTFTSSDPSIATIKGNRVIAKAAGTVSVVASQPGNRIYDGAYSITQQLVVTKAPQAITFGSLASKKFGDPPFTVTASSNSKLPVSFSTTTPGVVRVLGNVVTITGNGTAIIVASQGGNQDFSAAANSPQQFNVSDAGNLYSMFGSTNAGGPNNTGVVFGINSDGSDFGVLKTFGKRTQLLPQAGFIKGSDGKLYGNSYWGGENNSGSVIRLEGDGSGFTYLGSYNFGTTGGSPFGNLIQASNGDLYATTSSGGSFAGTIVRIKTDGSSVSVVFNFNNMSGFSPLGGLVQASDGRLYGATRYGGFFGSGTIFGINPDGSDLAVILNLNENAPIKSGDYPRGELIQGSDGFLYGTLLQGGASGKGTLFKIKTNGTSFTKLIDFDGTTFGAAPSATMLLASDGILYGMTQSGGAHNLGTAYSIHTDGTSYTRLLDFDGASTGANPIAKLTEGSNGALYGTTNAGGLNSTGVAFKFNKNGTGFQKLWDFALASGANPVFGPLVESSTGGFIGTTSQGGTSAGGVIFEIDDGGQYSVLDDVAQEESKPVNLISDAAGSHLFGIAQNPRTSTNGSIFSMGSAGDSYQRIMDIPADETVTSIYYVSTGHLWALAQQNGIFFIFRMKTDGSEYERLFDFDNATAKGSAPNWLMEVGGGDVYGATQSGGTAGTGSIFRMKNDGTGFTKILDMPNGTLGLGQAHFIQGSDGIFYGVTNESSIVFKFNAAGVYSQIFTFPQAAGELPVRILELNSGSLAIITRDNGSGGSGSIFSISKDGSSFQKIFDPLASEGTNPAEMLETTDGWLYVATQSGGSEQNGMIYKIRGDGSGYTNVHDFTKAAGELTPWLLFRKLAQSFAFGPIPGKLVSDPPFVPDGSSSSGAPLRFSSSDTTIAVIANGMIKPVGVGTVTITANLPADANFFDGGSQQQTLVVSKGVQTITFDALPPITLPESSFDLNAVSSSALPVSYLSSNLLVATVAGKTVTITGVGKTTITAYQQGNANYFAADSVKQILTVNPDDHQTIQFSSPGEKILGDPPFQLTATASSQLAVTYSSTSSRISISGSTVTMLLAGNVSVMADQPGNADYQAAPQVQVSFCIDPPKPVIASTGTAFPFILKSSNDSGNQWYLNDVVIAGAVGDTLSVTSNGLYKVITTIDGCASASSDAATVSVSVFIATGFEPDPRIAVYPNPVTDALQIDLGVKPSGPVSVFIIDAVGQVIKNKPAFQNRTETIDFLDVPPGLYIVRIVSAGGTVFRKICKR